MKNLCFVFLYIWWLWDCSPLYAVFEINVEANEDLGEQEWSRGKGRNKESVFYEVRKEGKKPKTLFFHKPITLKDSFTVKTQLPIIFTAPIECEVLMIDYTGKCYDAINQNSITCQKLQLVHKINLVYFYNNGEVIFSKKTKNPVEVRQVSLKDYVFINHGTLHSKCGLTFTWGKGLPEEGLLYDIKEGEEDEARIQNYGTIQSTQDIKLDVPVYIGSEGIIKTSRGKKIHHSNERTYPVYAIVRIPEDVLLSYISQTITPGQLGEESAKHFYQKFELIPTESIGTFKVNNSDNGLDVVCKGNPVVVHESKNYSDSSFSLSKSSAGVLQCSRPWLAGHFSSMLSSIQTDEKTIAEELEDQDDVITEIIKQKKEKIKFCKSIITTLNIKKNKRLITFDETKLVLNGSSIYHVTTPLEGVSIPFYYCQRNIQSAL